MSYYKRTFNKRRFNYNSSNKRDYRDNRDYRERKPYYRHTYRDNYSRSRSRSNKRRHYSRRENNMFKMYNKNSHLSSSSSSSSLLNSNGFSVNREKTCPFLLRVFYKINGNNSLYDFEGEKFPRELDIYTWEDANLKELAKFIHDAFKDTVYEMYDLYEFWRIYYDSKGTFVRDKIGNVVINDKKSKLNENIKTSLKDMGFQIGDFFDINITTVNGKK